MDSNSFLVPTQDQRQPGTFSFPSGLTQSDSDNFNISSIQSTPPKKKRKVDDNAPQLGFIKRLCTVDDEDVLSGLDVIWFVVQGIRKPCVTQHGFRKNVKQMGETHFVEWLRGVIKNESWDELIRHELFSIPKDQTQADVQVYKDSIHRAWESSFRGNAAAVLLEIIKTHLDKSLETYSRHTSIVNSSGTGKSRMVDENAYRVITIPICLRDGVQGYPPPDADLRDWLRSLANRRDQQFVARSLHGFVTSLLKVLWKHLQEIPNFAIDYKDASEVIKRHEQIASAFRKRMTTGQTFTITNDYRRKFYDEVIKMSKELATTSESEPSSHPDFPQRYGKGTIEAAAELCGFIDPMRLLDTKGPRRPHIIFAFDEAHTLTDNPEDTSWTLFSELRRTLRTLRDLPIYSLFLSTAGRFHQFSPDIKSDPSYRIAYSIYPPLDPISEVSFDDLAYPAKEDTVDLDRVVQMDWIAHLGRPLFASVYDAMGPGRVTMILQLAKRKLLNKEFNRSILEPNNGPGILACLSVRFGLEFKSDDVSRQVASTQVERHVLLCIAATTGPGKLVTMASSEPLLAEAAFDLMKHNKNSPARFLAQHSDLNCVHLGDRGELVAALIIMQARDAAAATGNRWTSVADFMKELLRPEDYDKLLSSLPRFWRKDEDKPFGETFENYVMWFNHVIKVNDPESLKSEHAWKFITRGAMIVCANNQEGLDLFLPMTTRDGNLSRDGVSGLLIQIRNRRDFPFSEAVLDAIDPIQLGLFSKQQTPRPIIRIVFSFGSGESGVIFPPRRPSESHHPDPFTSFDIWCSGLSNGTPFKCVSEDADAYNYLLKRSLQLDEAFEFDDKVSSKELKVAREGLRRKLAPLKLMSIPVEHSGSLHL